MTGPLVVEFDVATSVEHAFAVWVEQLDRWWPTGKTVSGADIVAAARLLEDQDRRRVRPAAAGGGAAAAVASA